MQIDKTHLALIADIYDVALDPTHWIDRLDRLAACLGAAGASIQLVDPHYEEAQVQALSSAFDLDRLRWDEVYSTRLFGTQVHDIPAYQYLLRQGGPGFHRDVEALGFSDDSELAEHPPTAVMREYMGTFYRAASLLNDNRVWVDTVAVQFREGRGHMTEAERELGSVFLPHLAKVVELNRSFLVLRARYQAVLDALDHFQIGTFLVRPDAEVVLRNLAAERILEQGDGLRLAHGGRLKEGGEAAGALAAG